MNEKYEIQRTETKLVLRINFTPTLSLISSIMFSLLFVAMIFPSLLLIIYASNPHGLQAISYFLFFIVMTTFFFFISLYIPYLYFQNKDRTDMFSFDKIENLLLFKRKSGHYREVNLNHIEKLKYYSISVRSSYIYYLSLILKDNQKIKIISQTDSKSDVIQIGEMISDFLEIPFVNKEPRIQIVSIIIILMFGLLIYFVIFLPFYSSTELGRLIAVLMIISLFLPIIIGLILFKIFKKKGVKYS